MPGRAQEIGASTFVLSSSCASWACCTTGSCALMRMKLKSLLTAKEWISVANVIVAHVTVHFRRLCIALKLSAPNVRCELSCGTQNRVDRLD